ncbi:MAG: HD domain-containing phosphohydrolase [Actinomycetota bacterium]
MLNYSKLLFYVLPLIAALVSITFGIYSLRYKPLGKISTSFSFYSFIALIVSITLSINASTLSLNVARISFFILNLFILIAIPAMFVFVIDIAKNRISNLAWYFKVLFFIPSLILAVLRFIFRRAVIVYSANYGFIDSSNGIATVAIVAIPLSIGMLYVLLTRIKENNRYKTFNLPLYFLFSGNIFIFIGFLIYEVLIFIKVLEMMPFVETLFIIQYIISSVAILIAEQNIRSISYKKLLTSIGDATIILDEYGSIIDINNTMVDLLELPEDINKNVYKLGINQIKEFLLKRTKETKTLENIICSFKSKENGVSSAEISFNKDSKRKKYYNVLVSPIIVGKDTKAGKFAIFKDITEYKTKENELRYLSFHDGMTDLYNRIFMEEEMKRLDTERQLPLCVVMGDVNGLKMINDSFGHQMGDELLCSIASILKSNFRREDIVARWGGDEFLVLLPKTSIKDTDIIISRIKSECKKKSTSIMPLSISLGVAIKTSSSQELIKIIKDAEDSMYSFKFKEQRSIQNDIVSSLEKTLEEKDFETEVHAKRLEEMALEISNKLNLSDKEKNELVLLSALHDLGKVSIAENILSKPGKLTPEEWKLIKKHPEAGYRIAETVSYLAPISEGILYHHERWDGEGYPKGLKKLEIPLNARIINIIDSFDVMTQGRPYQAAKSKQEAILELKRCSGTQFDPKLVKILIKIIG